MSSDHGLQISEENIAKALNDYDNAKISAPPARIDATEGGNVNAGHIVHNDGEDTQANSFKIKKITTLGYDNDGRSTGIINMSPAQME